jgi:hypothetical protein
LLQNRTFYLLLTIYLFLLDNYFKF